MVGKKKLHRLHHTGLDKVFHIELADLNVRYETGTLEKLKSYDKPFKSKEEALKFFEKKEWEMLKKGFVLSDKNPGFGNPKLHYFTSSGYSGCLSFANTPKGIYVYQQGSYDDPNDQYDFMVHIDKLGNLLQTIKLPDILAWDIQFNRIKNELLLKLDHHIYVFDLDNERFTKLADREKGNWASFIAVANALYGYGTNEKLVVKNIEETVVYTQEYVVEIIKGKIPFCSVLAKSKPLLALHTKPGEILVVDIEKKQTVQTIKGDFDIVAKMEFVDADKTLVIKEYYQNKLQFVNIEKNVPMEYSGLDLPSYTKGVDAFAFNANETKLVQIQGTRAYVYDFKNKKIMDEFKFEHCVKRAEIEFIDDDLGVRTDYGCFSLYQV